MSSYAAEYAASLADPAAYWLAQAALIDWSTSPELGLDDTNAPLFRWFPDGVLNTCHNAVDRHVEAGHGDRLALIHESPVTGTSATFTYAELQAEVARLAGALRQLGVSKGDRIVIYMPMIPEAVISMLACARLGAIHSVVFGGFSAQELALRIDDTCPIVVLSASCGIEPSGIVQYKPLLDSALARARHQPSAIVVKQRSQCVVDLDQSHEHDWDSLMADPALEPASCADVAATDPLYVLYTSGTTGQPKGIVRDNGGHAVAMAWSMKYVYDVKPGDVWWAASDVGWVVGHSYIAYGPLIAGATSVLYEGKPVGTPDASAFWRVIERYGVQSMFTAPTAIRAIRREDPEALLIANHDLSTLSSLFLAGERLDPDTEAWATQSLGVPVIDNWWQTETGWPIVSNLMGLEPKPIRVGSPGLPVPGYDVRILDPLGADVPDGQEGNICIRLPLPPGTLPTLWQNDERYVSSYLSAFHGHFLTGDSGYRDKDGYVYVLGRTDDVINVAGHRLSTGVMEAVVAAHPAVAECAVIGIADDLKGQIPSAFVVLKSGGDWDPAAVSQELVANVREAIGPVAAMRRVFVVEGLPKTRSGKILRKTIRQIVDGEEAPVPATIEDTNVLDRLRVQLTDPTA